MLASWERCKCLEGGARAKSGEVRVETGENVWLGSRGESTDDVQGKMCGRKVGESFGQATEENTRLERKRLVRLLG